MRERSTFFPELESLRGVAITLVFLYHADGLLVPGHAVGVWVSPLVSYVRAGHVGVDLFFVLSGFLLALPYLAEIDGGRPVSVARYFERRALRILPAYYVAVAAAATLTAQRPADLLHGLPYLVFLQSFVDGATPLIPYSIPWWSLATEAQFYLALPLTKLAGRPWLRWALAGALAAWAAALAGFRLDWWEPRSALHGMVLRASLFGRGPVFLCGVAAAFVHRRWATRAQAWLTAAPAPTADLALLALLLALGGLLSWESFVGPFASDDGARGAWHTIAGGLWAAIMLLLLLAPLRAKWLLINRAWGLVGRWSYSFFLIHLGPLHWAFDALLGPPPPDQIGWTPHNVGKVAAVFAACLAASGASYRLIERPFLEWKSRVRR
jgi:peptidoglycan/LPS O-acetylase OafA/YrhL